MKLERSFGVIIPMVRQNIEESPHQVKALSSNVRHLKDRAYSLTDELGSGLNCLFLVFNEYWYFPSPGRFQDLCQLGDRLLQNLRRANVNFGYHHHDRHIQCKSNTQMLSKISISSARGCGRDGKASLAHANQPVVRCNHQKTIIRTATEQPKDGGAKISFVAGQIGEADDFGLVSLDLTNQIGWYVVLSAFQFPPK